MLIKKPITIQDIQKCIAGNGWSFGNEILYEMCRKYPEHNKADIIVGKVWLIGRSYAAAIERRKNVNADNSGDDFYFNVVAPKMLEVGEELDERINGLKKYNVITIDNLKEILDTHLFLTNIFADISGHRNRSLASKYLHFHVPNMFYIFDSRAIQAAKSYVIPNKQLRDTLAPFGDKEYIDLVIRLFTFQNYVKNQYGITMTPRVIDSFLLKY